MNQKPGTYERIDQCGTVLLLVAGIYILFCMVVPAIKMMIG